MDKNTLLIIGAGGHGKVAADIAMRSKKYNAVCFFDDAVSKQQCMCFPVIGRCEEIFRYIDLYDVFIAIGNAESRKRFMEKLIERGAQIATLIHPNAVIGQEVQIGVGSIMAAGAVLNPDCRIGKGCIVNTCASVDHDCRIGDYVHVSVGAHVAGTVTIGAGTWIGAGAVVNNDLHIADSSMIGSGAVVVNDIKERGTYVGVPARRLKMKEAQELSVSIEENGHGVIFGGGQIILQTKIALILLSLTALRTQSGR